MFDAAFKISLVVGIGLTLAEIVIGLIDMKPTTKKWLAGILGVCAIAAFGAAILSCPIQWQSPLVFRSPIKRTGEDSQWTLIGIEDPYFLVSYGADAEKICSATLDGSPFTKLSDKYRIVLICGMVDSSVDQWTDTRITISPAFTIQAFAVPIRVPQSKNLGTTIQHALAAQVRSIPSAAKKLIGVQWVMWCQGVLLPNGVNPYRSAVYHWRAGRRRRPAASGRPA